jgi:hypothetical protein
VGRIPKAISQMEAFGQVLSDCNLHDLGFCGPSFTWCNDRDEYNIVWERIDRGVGNEEWSRLFPNSQVRHLPFVFSDHAAIMIDFQGVSPSTSKRKRLFRFEHAWTKQEGCEEVISGAWSDSVVGTKMFQTSQKIKNCRLALLKWNREEGFHIPSVLKEKKARLLFLESNGNVMQQRQAVLQLRWEI